MSLSGPLSCLDPWVVWLLTEKLLDLLGLGLGQLHVVRDRAGLLRGLVLEQVSTTGLLTHDLAGAGEAEALLGAAVGLHLRHGADLLQSCGSLRTHGASVVRLVRLSLLGGSGLRLGGGGLRLD